jgi:crotonobetainyl-CoA:carnitine CoA-transferase CaiB-like acyl-CoA transferase
LRDVPGHDLNYQAWTGALAARAPEIRRAGLPIADLAGGSYAAMAICAALVARERHGQGCSLDVSMADVLLSWAGPMIDGSLASSDDPAAGFPAYGAFECLDGAMTLGVVSEQPFWLALCGTLGVDDVADLDVAERVERGAELRARLEAIIAGRRRDEVVAELLAVGVPVAPVLSAAEAVRAEAFVQRGTSIVGDDGEVSLVHPVRFT